MKAQNYTLRKSGNIHIVMDQKIMLWEEIGAFEGNLRSHGENT